MTLPVDEFMRRFLLHVLPDGFNRIRHYGFLAGAARAEAVAGIRRMIRDVDCASQGAERPAAQSGEQTVGDDERETSLPCRCCGGRMTIIERFARGAAPQAPFAAAWSDTS